MWGYKCFFSFLMSTMPRHQAAKKNGKGLQDKNHNKNGELKPRVSPERVSPERVMSLA